MTSRTQGAEPPTRTQGAELTSPSKRTGRHRVVVIGSGFGGLFTAKALRRAEIGRAHV